MDKEIKKLNSLQISRITFYFATEISHSKAYAYGSIYQPLYVLKNMDIMEPMPFKARKAVFDRLEQIASKANMSVEERNQYETEWKIYNDYFNTIDSAKREGKEEGREEGRIEGREEGRIEGREEGIILVAQNLKRMGMTNEQIQQATGLTLNEIAQI